MTTLEKMDFLKEVLSERRGTIAVGWRGLVPEGKTMSLLNKTHLLAVTAHEGEPRVARFAGAVEFARGGSHVVFRGDVVAVANGPRKGITMTPDQLREDERGVATARSLVLKAGKGPREIDLERQPDQELVEQAYDMLRDDLEVAETLTTPTVYLAVKDESELICRVTAETMSVLKGFEDYEDAMSPADNFRRLIPRVGISAEDGRELYPYAMCYGYGLLLVDVGARGRGAFIPAGEVDVAKGCVKVFIEEYLKKMEEL